MPICHIGFRKCRQNSRIFWAPFPHTVGIVMLCATGQASDVNFEVSRSAVRKGQIGHFPFTALSTHQK